MRVFATDGRQLLEGRVVTALGSSRAAMEAQALVGLKHFMGRSVVRVSGGDGGGSLTGRGGCCCPTLPGRGFLGARDATGRLRFVLPLPPARNCCHSACQLFGAALCLPCALIGGACRLCGVVCGRCIAAVRCDCCGLKTLHTITREYPRQVIRSVPVLDASGETLVAHIVLQVGGGMAVCIPECSLYVSECAGRGGHDEPADGVYGARADAARHGVRRARHAPIHICMRRHAAFRM